MQFIHYQYMLKKLQKYNYVLYYINGAAQVIFLDNNLHTDPTSQTHTLRMGSIYGRMRRGALETR